MTRAWTRADEDCLIVWGKQAGDYDFVAEHDLGFPPGSGTERIKLLRRLVPERVAEREAWANEDICA